MSCNAAYNKSQKLLPIDEETASESLNHSVGRSFFMSAGIEFEGKKRLRQRLGNPSDVNRL
jgi:hypothetical protein